MKKYISLTKVLSLFAILTVLGTSLFLNNNAKAEEFTLRKPSFDAAANYEPAAINPPPTATFTSPTNNSTTDSTKINVSFNLKANNSELLNKNVYVQLLVANSPSTSDEKIVYELIDDYKVVTFSQTTESKSITFNNIPLLYPGNNYIYCFIQTTNSGDFCGGFYNPNIVNVKYTGTKAPLYRFYSQEYTGHFYTTNPYEKKHVVNNYPDYTWYYEGIAYSVGSINSNNNCLETSLNKIHRFWSNKYKHHFYTINEQEKNNVITNDPNWGYEGVSFCASTTQIAGSSPVFRFYSATKNSHFYTINEEEKNHIMANDPSWKFEGIAYYAFK